MDQIGKEKIISLLQDTILSLCQKSYHGSIEVDGIICITSLYSADQHVVKIHQKLNSLHSDVPLNSEQDQITLDLHVEAEQALHSSNGNRVLYGKGTRGKAKTKTVRERKIQRKRENIATKKTDVGFGATNNVDKYPYLMKTLCGNPAEVVMTNLEQNSEDSSHSENVTSSREDTPVRDLEQPSLKENSGLLNDRSRKFDNFWKAVLKKRMADKEKSQGKTADERGIQEIEMVQVKQEPEDNTHQEQMAAKDLTDTNINTQMEEQNNVISNHEQNFSRESSTENMFQDGNDNQEYTAYSTNQNEGYDSNHGNIDNQKSTKSDGMYITMKEGGMYIKQEPLWEDEYSQNSSQSRSNYDSNEVRGQDNQENMSAFTNDPSGLVDESSIKKEPDLGESFMETENSHKTNDTESSSGRNSILLKILKGKSLKEAYKNNDTLGTFPDQVDNSPVATSSFLSNQESSDKRDNPTDQDNSLLYRLPFVSFQDLFSPGKNSTLFPPIDTNNSASRLKTSTSSPSSKNNTAFETLARTLLETNDDNSSRSKRSSSMKQVSQLDYQYDYGSDEDSEDDDDDVDDDPYDSSYIPYREDEIESPPRKIRTRQVKKTTFKSVPIGVSGSKRKKAEYTCGLCGLKFDSIGERNRHEERELRERGLDQPEFVKCPLCKGFFADEASRNKHMIERHHIAAPHGL